MRKIIKHIVDSHRRKSYRLFYSSVFIIFVLDQLSKRMVIDNMVPGQSFRLIDDLVSITYVQNTGAAFGLFRGFNWILLLIGVAVLYLIYFYDHRISTRNRLYQITLGIIFGGSLGNIMDRFMRGFVVDFIDFHVWPVFNVADTAINIGVVILILSLFSKKERKDVSRAI